MRYSLKLPVMLFVGLAMLLAACGVPVTESPHAAAVTLPASSDGSTRITGRIADYDGPSGTVDAQQTVYGTEYVFAEGTIGADGQLAIDLLVPPRERLWQVKDAWADSSIDVTASNPNARVLVLYTFNLYAGRQTPFGYVFEDNSHDPDADVYEPEVGDRWTGYIYSSEPTRVRINHAYGDGNRYQADLNLGRGWQRIVTEVIRVETGFALWRDTVDLSTAVPWQWVSLD